MLERAGLYDFSSEAVGGVAGRKRAGPLIKEIVGTGAETRAERGSVAEAHRNPIRYVQGSTLRRKQKLPETQSLGRLQPSLTNGRLNFRDDDWNRENVPFATNRLYVHWFAGIIAKPLTNSAH